MFSQPNKPTQNTPKCFLLWLTALILLIFPACTPGPAASSFDSPIENQPETSPPSAAQNDSCIAESELPWEEVQVPATGVYGEQQVTLPAHQYWVNSGLFLKRGQKAVLKAKGSWSLEGNELPVSEGGECHTGYVLARIGYENITCFQDESTFVATEDGIVYLGMMITNGQGDFWGGIAEDNDFGIRHHARGTKQVTIISDGSTVPTVNKCDAPTYDFSRVESGWVELRAQNIVLTLPAALAEKEKSSLEAALNRFDESYTHLSQFFNRRPYNHQPIRFVPAKLGYNTAALAGNPIQLHQDIFYSLTSENNLIRDAAGARGSTHLHEMHTVLHELVHDFAEDYSFYGHFTAEVWPDFIPLYVFDQWAIPTVYQRTEDCDESTVKTYWENDWGDGVYNWDIVCFFRQFQMRFGWDFYLRFYTYFSDEQLLITENELLQGLPEPEGENAPQLLDPLVWTYTYNVFQKIAKPEEQGEITELFERWGVPTNAIAGQSQ